MCDSQARVPGGRDSGVNSSRLSVCGVRAIARDLFVTLVCLAVMLLAAGTVYWINAWVVIGLSLGLQTANAIVQIRWNPELLNARGKTVQEGTKPFDKAFVALYLPISFACFIVAGLDAVRYGWSSMPLGFSIFGVVLFVVVWALGCWAMAVNKYFETTVRIQHERGHRVCTAGPYRLVRHPGYLAAILGAPSMPLILGSWWAFVPTGVYVLVLVVRTALEDRTLLEELPGYADYAKSTRYRLIPRVW
jgi:protein-S-isoprenylcysteine O-methyltransferase Ste14